MGSRHGTSPRRGASPRHTRPDREAIRFNSFLEVLVRCAAHRMPVNRSEDSLTRRLRGLFKHLKSNALLRTIWAQITVRPTWEAVIGSVTMGDEEEQLE